MARPLHLTLSADPSEATKLRNELRGWMSEAGINGPTGHDVVLAVDEAFSNAIQHPINRASQEITISGDIFEQRLIVRIADKGRWQTSVDPTRAHYGHHLMDKLMDRVEIDQHHTGTIVTLHETMFPRTNL
jgi:anti-sigma regulatory factor (Ser/Thr protein kinase)